MTGFEQDLDAFSIKGYFSLRVKFLKILSLVVLIVCGWGIAIHYEIDLPTLYVAVKNAAEGNFASVYADHGLSIQLDGSTRVLGRYFYPPFSLSFFSFLAYFKFSVAKYLWLLIQTGAFIICWKGFSTLYPAMQRNLWVWWVAFFVSINPIHNNFQSNNIQLILMSLLLVSELLSRSTENVGKFLGGTFCVLPTGLKVYPAFLLPYFWIRHDKFFRWGMLAGIFLIVVLPFLAFGFSGGEILTKNFLHNLGIYGGENQSVDLYSLQALITAYWGGHLSETGLQSLGVFSQVALVVSYLFCLFQCRKDLSENTQGRMLAFGLAMMTLLTPSTRPHYLIFLVPAFIALTELATSLKARSLWAVVMVSFALVCLTAEGVVGHTWNEVFEAWKLPVVGMILLVISIAIILPISFRRSGYNVLK